MLKIKNHNILSIMIKIIYADGQFDKSGLKIVLKWLKIHLNLMNISQKTTMKKVMDGIYLN